MKFTQPCLIMNLENNAIDWALFVGPGEEYTKGDAVAQCDKLVDSFYVYPVKTTVGKTGAEVISATMDRVNAALTRCHVNKIPGIFELT